MELVVLQVETAARFCPPASNSRPVFEQGRVFQLTIEEVERIEDRARRGLPIEPDVILALTAYLREALQAKLNAEAVASEVLKKSRLKSRYHTVA